MEKLIELLKQIQELAGVGIEALEGAKGAEGKPEGGPPKPEGGERPDGPPRPEGDEKPEGPPPAG